MRARLRNLWENVAVSLWFVPTLLVLAATVLAFVLVRVDLAIDSDSGWFGTLLIAGTPDAVRLLLSVIAGSLVTAISISFSVMVVAMQQVAVQFSPRVLRTFMADRGNQIVIGTYIATFVYSLLVLLGVPSTEEGGPNGFVPALAVTVAMALALFCLALLVYFIHHMAHNLQVAVLIDYVHDELIDQIIELYPPVGVAEHAAAAPTHQPQSAPSAVVRANAAGFIRSIDEHTLRDAPFADATWVLVIRQVGEFVTNGGILAEIHGQNANETLSESVRDAIIIGRERSIYQDPLFGIRQLADIALKALSPAINDMTTAEYVLVHLGDALGHLARRDLLPRTVVHSNGRCRITFNHPHWQQFVDDAFSQIRRQAAGDVHVTHTILRVLHDLATHDMPPDRHAAISHQVHEIRLVVEKQSFSDADRRMLYEAAERVDAALVAHVAGMQVATHGGYANLEAKELA